MVKARRGDQGTAAPGAYLLFFRLPRGLAVAFRRQTILLPRGSYAYCGSAKGPGGVAARVARHRRKDKAAHWHIDQITLQTPVRHAAQSRTLSECDLVRGLVERHGATTPVPGFGSSDCKVCEAHFLALGQDIDFIDLLWGDLEEI